MRILPFALLAACVLQASHPFLFYAENTGQEAPEGKYRLYGVPKGTQVSLRSNAIHLRDTYGGDCIQVRHRGAGCLPVTRALAWKL